MIQDIKKIKEEIENHIEIDILFKLLPGTIIKYITLKDNEESFYLGGEYIKKGNEKIFLRQSGKTWAVPTKIRDNNNYIIYNSRFFIHKNELKQEKEKNIKEDIKEDIKENEKIIKSQQQVIDRMTKQIIKLQKDLNNKNGRILKLENHIKNNK
tara:strand:- start:117 stop:578 length:462 start_codon:yes stop_codon:yes gene_type:complete